MQPVKVFIGSSNKRKGIAKHIQAEFSSDIESTVWDQGIFELSKSNLDNLINITKKFDFAILLLGEDDVVIKNDKQGNITRDNVIFECGLFMGSLGTERTILVYDENERIDIPSDLLGITIMTYRKRNDENLFASISPLVLKISNHIKNNFINSSPNNNKNIDTELPKKIILHGFVNHDKWNWEKYHESINDLANFLIKNNKTPDLIIPIYDKETVGGATNIMFAKILSDYISSQMPMYNSQVLDVAISGRPPTKDRKAELSTKIDSIENIRSVLILDVVAFSGRTLSIVTDLVAKEFSTKVNIDSAVIAVSKNCIEKIKTGELKINLSFYSHIIKSNSIEFPWGLINSTGYVDERYLLIENPKFEIMERPWGWMEIICMNKNNCSVRILNIQPNKRLSLQRHKYRDELFLALDDGLHIEVMNEFSIFEKTIVKKGDYIFIPKNTYHRFSSMGKLVKSLEVSFGIYDQNDIERIEDDYGRPEIGDNLKQL